MQIVQTSLGTWFPRTVLHLDEVDAALRGERLPHHPRDLPGLLKRLDLSHVDVDDGPVRTLRARGNGMRISLTEDGIILLTAAGGQLPTVRQRLTSYYERAVGPFLEALFRRGMPLPQELADVRAVLPFFVLVSGGTAAEAAALVRQRGRRVGDRVGLGPVTVIPGPTITALHVPRRTDEANTPIPVDDILRYFTFFREFENQLHVYVRLHRDVWESIDAIRDARHLRYRDLSGIRDRLGAQRKTIGFVGARIAQMGDILAARSQYVHEAGLEPMLASLRLNRFDSLKGARDYVEDLWEVTDRYAEQTENLLRLVYEENLRREVTVLNIIFFGALITSFFGMNVPFPWESRWNVQWPATVLVTLLLIFLGVGGFLILHALILNRRFQLREIERGGSRPSRRRPT